MADTINVKVPPTLLRLGEADVKKLAAIGLERLILIGDIQDLMNLRYPNRKRAANAMTRLVQPYELEAFNEEMSNLREMDLDKYVSKSIETSYSRGTLTVRLYERAVSIPS